MRNSEIKLVRQTLFLSLLLLLLPLVAAAQGKIAFASLRDGNSEIYLMNADGSNQIRLTHTTGYHESDPTISPDGLKIAFTRVPIVPPDTYADAEIYIMTADGSNQINLTNHLARDQTPSFSHDGSKITFQSNREDGLQRIWIMDADGSNLTSVTSGPNDWCPSFSPDGSKIAFFTFRNSNWEIYLINADGSNEVNLTNNPALDQFLAFSPDGSKIAFETHRNGNQEIYLMNVDGSNQVNVTNSSGNDRRPAFSPDGSKIVFSSFRDGNGEIYRMNADGTNQTRLTNTLASEFGCAWSVGSVAPGKIAFISDRSGAPEIYLMNANGSNPTRLTNSPGAYESHPTISPDGSRIAFTLYQNPNYEVYVMNADGSNPINLTNNPAVDDSPAFSPDGSKIVFNSTRDGNAEIYMMNSDGSNVVRLTNSAGDDMIPSFSPDGLRITFQSYRNGNWDIYVMDVDGSNQTQLTTNSAWDEQPTFSRDGSRIAFISLRDGNYEVYAMNVDGSGQINLTNSPATDAKPAHSPAGTKIAFYSNRNGNNEVYVMDSDGSNPVNLTNNAGFDVDPSWGVGSIGDYTPPTITPTVSGNLGNDGWYVTDVQVTWSVADSESAVSDSSGCETQTVSSDTSGITFTCTATSEGGTNSQSVTIKRDATAPALAPAVSPNPVYLNGTATASPGASDSLSGVASQNCAAVATSTVGSHSVSCTAIDKAGNSANADADYQVIYNFLGFFQPVDNLPTLNVVPAGRGIALRFSLSGNQGLAIFAAGYPASSPIPCDVNEPGDDIEETVSAGGNALSYDAPTDQYSYIWKTDKAWKGTCRMFVLKLNDGSQHLAKFNFK